MRMKRSNVGRLDLREISGQDRQERRRRREKEERLRVIKFPVTRKRRLGRSDD